MEEALSLFGLPRSLGQYKDKEVSVNTGRFGAYVKWGDKNVSLPKSFDPYTVNLEDCIAEIEKKIAKDQITKDLPKTVATLNDEPVELKYGRFGLYLSFKEKNYRIPKDTDVAAMSEQEAIDIVSGKKKSSAVAPLREFSSGAQILNGRYGEYIKYNGKNYKMPKGTTSKTITEEEVNKITGK